VKKSTVSQAKNHLSELLVAGKRVEPVLILELLPPAPRTGADVVGALLAEREESR
jgi:hypothetical protein